MSDNSADIVCFACRFGWDAHEATPVPDVRLAAVACTGKIEAEHILRAFRNGARGVILLACSQGACHFQDGNSHAAKRVYLLKDILSAFGIDSDRLRIVLGGGDATLGNVLHREIEALRALGSVARGFYVSHAKADAHE